MDMEKGGTLKPKPALSLEMRHNRFPLGSYLSSVGRTQTTTVSRVYYSSDYSCTGRIVLLWFDNAISVEILKEAKPLLYKMTAEICLENRRERAGTTGFVDKSKLLIPWSPVLEDKYLPLMIRVNVEIMPAEGVTDKSPCSVQPHFDFQKHVLSIHSALWQSRAETGDYSFIVDIMSVVRVHKALFIAQSACLRQAMCQRNELYLDDVDVNSVEAFAKCIYTGPSAMQLNVMSEVFVLCTRYNVKWLKDYCAAAMLKQFCCCTGCNLSPIGCFSQNLKKVFSLPLWTKFEQAHPEAATYLLSLIYLR